MDRLCGQVIELASEIAGRHRISPLEPLLAICRAVVAQDELSIAVIGRFKAGKSSFLNHLLGRNFLPVGVIPVTAVVTEIGYGPREKATVHFLDGRSEEVAVNTIRHFIAESENPGNVKQVSRLMIELPALERFRGLRFVDTPGLESALAHNTEAALNWLPNVGLALVAVSIDTPLSQHDLALLKSVYHYTPKVSILLTKADLLDEAECAEVLSFVNEQLTRTFSSAPEVFLYSVRPGNEQFKTRLEEKLICETLAMFQEQRRAILEWKLETLLRECTDYLTLALKSAEVLESEREALKKQVLGERETLDEVKSELRLLVRHAAGGTRAWIVKHLEEHRAELEARLLEALQAEFPQWTKNLRHSLESFEAWLQRSLSEELVAASVKERTQFLAPLERVKRQLFRALQSFRDQLSERMVRAFGVPLRTTETEIHLEEPRSPDIRIGRVFDHNWELLSPILPMWLVKPLVERHFAGKVPEMVEKNLSRLASQWEGCINGAMAQLGKEAERRLDELIETVERLITSSSNDAPKIRADLERIGSLRDEMREAASLDLARSSSQRDP